MDPSAIQGLRTTVRGAVLCPGQDGYDAARTIPNAMIDRRPAAIVRCTGAADVIACVRFAGEHDLLVSVRGGGHSVAGKSPVCDDGLMIDLSGMKGIRVNPSRKTVRVETGLTLGEFDRETQAFGLATTLGVVSKTGIAGLTLGGGWGHLHAKYGLALDNVIGADVVTADGRLLTVNASQNEDLSGACAEVAATSGSSRRCNTACMNSVQCSLAPYSTRLQKPKRLSTSFAITPRPFRTNWSSNAAHFLCLTKHRFLPSRLVTVDGLPKVKRS